MTKDYYKILGIGETNSQAEIKSAYRKLARKWHPDVAGNNTDVVERFKEITEAYSILSNTIKKEEYDRARRFYSYAKGETQKEYKKENAQKTESNSENEKHSQINFDWKEFVSKRMWEKSTTKKQEKNTIPKKGEDVSTDIEISIFEATSGTTKIINMLQTNVCPKCGGRKFVNGTKCSHCNGKGMLTDYKKFSVKIPAGIKDKSKIRLAGEGSLGINGGASGDLYITVHVKEPQNYKTEGLNILKTIPITPYEAILGTNVTISTLKGNLSVKIAPYTQNGQKIRLAGCGIVQNDKIGDMIVTVEVRIPRKLTAEELNLYKRLQELSSVGNIRDNYYD